jgi:hypothetical protein
MDRLLIETIDGESLERDKAQSLAKKDKFSPINTTHRDAC